MLQACQRNTACIRQVVVGFLFRNVVKGEGDELWLYEIDGAKCVKIISMVNFCNFDPLMASIAFSAQRIYTHSFLNQAVSDLL